MHNVLIIFYIAFSIGNLFILPELYRFSGDFSVGFAYNSPGGGFKFGSLDVKAAKKVHIVRGQIYGAVKYRNEWRACVIATE